MTGKLIVGLGLFLGPTPITDYIDDSHRAAELGFDVIEIADHLGMVAPLPTLAAIATAVPGVRVTNLVLNASFYRPHLLARDIAAVHQLSGGRFITSLGAGYAEQEFATAGIPFPSAGQRVRGVARTATAIREILADPAFVTQSDIPAPPIRIAGSGDRLLASAAHYADMVLINPGVTEPVLAERIDYTRAQAGGRADDITFCHSFTDIALDGAAPDLGLLRAVRPDLTEEELLALPAVLTGSLDEAIAKIRRLRELGIDYLTFDRAPSVDWNTLERLITAVRQDS
ncbi:TIGR03621 family F420-dependent LLM class oxidoreductase [Mycolicibacterium tokaiense]|uniref:TIGR03621 family F420-dependent LLM class oxidoreductase n=1 Tax=Mycolicibacterium tokaiense TaxID=39695 RepID=UPI0013D0AB13|nr:TIGR03621 family F420-dependent LLM class oxidoreductase [Mycolicibacterium tokaiense]